MKKLTLLIPIAVAATSVQAAIVVPTYLSGSSTPNSFQTSTPDQMVNNAGMNTAVNQGDSLASALAATHSYSGAYGSSWVTNASGGDYFVGGVIPVLVFDLGADTTISDLLLWQYENNGGGQPGNHTKTIDVRFNTQAEGTTFAGAADLTVNMLDVLSLGGTNSTQQFAAGNVTARYVELTIVDNYETEYPTGGDRVGLGEFRVHAVPEPSSVALLGVAALGGMIRRRR